MSATVTTIREREGRVILENALVRLEFDRQRHGALLSLVDLTTGTDLIRDTAAPRLLWRLSLRRNGGVETEQFTSAQADRTEWSVAQEADDATLTLTSSGLPESGLEVRVTVALADGSAVSRWRMTVTGVGDNVAVTQLVCPVLCGLVKLGDPAPGETLLAPVQGEAYLYHNPFPVRDHLPLRTGAGPEMAEVGVGSAGGRYPGALALQMMALYNDCAGLYFAAEDAGQHPKDLHMGPAADLGEGPVLTMTHLLSECHGADVTLPYDTVVGVFHGDWYDAAALYKAWATQQWWCARKLWDRDLADWLRTGVGGVFQMSNYAIPRLDLNHSMDEIADTVNAIAADAGVPLLSLTFNWENGGAWTGPKGFFPPREGEEAFRAAMRKLREAGNVGMVYITGGCWYLKLPYVPPYDSWPAFEAEGQPNAIRSVTGEVPIGRWFKGWESTRLCANTPYNREVTIANYLGCLDLGCRVIQIDNFPCGGSEACYDPTHGHPIGHGPWWSEAWGETLAELRRRAKAVDPDCALTTEGTAENFIPYLDLADQRAGNMEYFGHYGPGMPMGGETVPLFGFIYNEYLGSYYAAMPECNRPEVLYWTRGLGKALCQGVLPSAGRYFPEPKGLNPVTLAFYEKIVRATGHELYPYLMFGEMLRPPDIEVPTFTAQYCKFVLDDTSHYVDPHQRHEVTDRAVQHAAYRGRDGSVCLLFVNVSDQQVDFSLALPPYAFEGPVDVEQITDTVTRREMTSMPLGHRVNLNMAPFSITLLVMREAQP